MPYERLKEEQYSNIGGINTKASKHVTGENEVLDIRNLSFQFPGSLESRPGYSLYTTGATTKPVTGLYEFSKSDGSSFILFAIGATLYKDRGGSYSAIGSSLSGKQLDFTTMNDSAFLCDGSVFKKFDGITLHNYGLPVPDITMLVGSVSYGPVYISGNLSPYNTASPSGTYYIQLAYLSKFGFLGPISNRAISATAAGTTPSGFIINSLSLIPWLSLFPSGYGITALVAFISPTLVSTAENTITNPAGLMKTWYQSSGVTNSLAGFVFGGPYTNYQASLLQNQTYIPVYYASASYAAWNTSEDYFLDRIFSFTMKPKFVDLYQNKLFMAGFSQQPSLLYYSETTYEERVFVDNFFPIRTNDNDTITAMAPYQGSLLVFKEESITEISGTSAVLSSADAVVGYGAISDQAIVQFESKLWFLDRKGIAEYNGINTAIVSNRVESYLDRMNVNAARDKAQAVHWKRRNEVWFAIPIDDSVENNIIIVHDYLANAWTVYEGFLPAQMLVADGNGTEDTLFFSGYNGSNYIFGESLTSDNGAAISMMVQTRFHKRLGDTTQELWRKFYINTSIPSVTTPVTVDFIPNYGTGSSLTRTVYLDDFQKKFNLGLSARSMSVKMSLSSSTDKILINGYALETRYLRND